jgi:hypothetical protein
VLGRVCKGEQGCTKEWEWEGAGRWSGRGSERGGVSESE